MSPKLKIILSKLIYNSIISEIESNLTNSNIGSRKGKSPRDHLFVMYSVIQETLNSEHQRDIIFYDVKQCYDSLWVERCLLDMYENGVTSNLLNLVYELSKKAKITIKTPVGDSDEGEIDDIIMQGETLSGIICTNSMDKVSKDCDIEPLKYKEIVNIPKLGYVDDIADINNCGEKTKEMNQYTTKAINERRLQFSIDKCARMHVGKGAKNKTDMEHKCPEVQVDKWEEIKKIEGNSIKLVDEYQGKVNVKEVNEYEYLGDIVVSDGSNTKNVKKRAAKGYGIIRDIKEILEKTYFGPFFVEALIIMRNSMLSSILTYNLEVSSKLSKKDLKVLDDVDMKLLRDSLSLSSKSSKTLIHAELGLLSMEYIIKKNRIMYLHHLLSSEGDNLARQVLVQQINSTKRYDWINIVEKDLEEFKITLSYDQIANISKPCFKKIIKNASKSAYFENIIKNKQQLSKGSEISYHELSLQNYMKSSSNLLIENMKIILKIRIRDIQLKCNFPGAFSDKKCLASPSCKGDDSNSHVFQCEFTTSGSEVCKDKVIYEDIFSDKCEKQSLIANIFLMRLEKRKSFMNPTNMGLGPADPRHRTIVPLGIKEARRNKGNKKQTHTKSS